VYKILVRKPEGKVTLRWEANIRKDLGETGWKGVE
jgi:hypothetical protein